MGTFADFRSGSYKREGWTYSYTGSQLLEVAEKKYNTFTQLEENGRLEMAARMKDMTTRATGDDTNRLRSKIEKLAEEREKLLVWIHEFKRTPEKEYTLGLGDVTYFELSEQISNEVIDL